jgi:hypothetical protein
VVEEGDGVYTAVALVDIALYIKIIRWYLQFLSFS